MTPTGLTSSAATMTPTEAMLRDTRSGPLPRPAAGGRVRLGTYVQAMDDDAVAIVRGAFLSDYVVAVPTGDMERWSPSKCHRLVKSTGERMYAEQAEKWASSSATSSASSEPTRVLVNVPVAEIGRRVEPEPLYTGEDAHTVAVALSQYHAGMRRHLCGELRTILERVEQTPDGAPAVDHERNERALRHVLGQLRDTTHHERYHNDVAAGRSEYTTPALLAALA